MSEIQRERKDGNRKEREEMNERDINKEKE
jgi:hypothetical protein